MFTLQVLGLAGRLRALDDHDLVSLQAKQWHSTTAAILTQMHNTSSKQGVLAALFLTSAFSTAAARMRTAALISFMAARTLPSGSMSVTCHTHQSNL